MRYSRLRRKKQGRKHIKILSILLIVFLVLFFGLAGFLGKFISNFIISPIFTQQGSTVDDETLPPDGNESESQRTKDEADSLSDQRLTENIQLKPINFYALQVGAYEDIKNCQLKVNEIKPLGEGGYVLEDNYFRAIAGMYTTNKQIEEAEKALHKKGIEYRVHSIPCKGLNLKVSASSDRVEFIDESIQLIHQVLNQMPQLTVEVQKGDKDVATAVKELKIIYEQIKEKLKTLSSLAKGDNKPLTGMKNIYENYEQRVKIIIDENFTNSMVFLSQIKYTYSEMVIMYRDFINHLSTK